MRTIRIRTAVLALVSALALSACAASAASAAELEQVPPSGKFKVSSSSGKFETVGGTSVSCTKATGEGEVTGAKTGKSKVTFEGCTGPLGVKCTSSGASSGDIVTEANSELVWLSKASKIAGFKLALTKEETISCSIIKLTVRGATLCPVEPVNTKTTTFKLPCKETSGKQEYREYENEKGEKFKAITETSKGSGFEESALSATETLTFAEAVEIKT